METGGISARLIRFANTIVGNLPGGLAIVAVLGCTFFAAISGSSAATTAAVGGILIPHMVKKGYDVRFSSALRSRRNDWRHDSSQRADGAVRSGSEHVD